MKGVMVPRVQPENINDCDKLFFYNMCSECSYGNHAKEYCPYRKKFRRDEVPECRDMR